MVNRLYRTGPDGLQAFCLLLLLLAAVSGCKTPTRDPDKEVKYTGPLRESINVQTLYSDSAKVKVKVTAPLQQEYENGDAIFPKGIFITFFEEEGKPASTLQANYGRFDKQKDMYVARGNVIVQNIAKQEKLNTEELHWDRQKETVYTDKFVRIETAEEILTGHGLRSNQDFSRYKILKPSGIFSVKQP